MLSRALFPGWQRRNPTYLKCFQQDRVPSFQVTRQSEGKTVNIFTARLSGRLGTPNAFLLKTLS